MAEVHGNDQKTTSSLSKGPSHRVVLSFSARGIIDRDLQDIIEEDVIKKGCTELDMSENLITQRGASILGNLLEVNKVS